MSGYLEQAVAELCQAAGWKTAQPDPSGAYGISLEHDLELHIFSPDGSTCIFWSPVLCLPEDGYAQEQLILQQAKLALAAGRKRKSVISIHEGNIVLHLLIASQETGVADIPGLAKDFLNDLAWWKKQLGADA